MFIVGVTGGIATGKSTVCDVFREYGIPVIDADVAARKVVEPGRKAWRLIKKEFGDAVFHKDGQLNREILGEIIFDSVEKRRKLNEITHPEIYSEMFWAAVKCFFQGHQFIVMDLPLLFESGSMLDYLYKIIVVTCEEDLQLQRLMERNSMSESKAKKRISAQMSLERKCEQAHFVVENSGTIQDTREQVLQILYILRSYKAHWKLRAVAGLCCTGLVSFLIWIGFKFLYSQQSAVPRRR
ncbi:dephospho-CoA kinase domain-containing protein [Cryptotermes secundus]|uniref:dephospho-CoA kinase domain-containing protein n=1 Tax=Cryptotermes secundus TaxID=105785 RepID=UPI000CD7C72B|nr:dephospho-CoA kinase domain-containing protein [Cryptotermes secundus]